jgi:XapX domain-containing protein
LSASFKASSNARGHRRAGLVGRDFAPRRRHVRAAFRTAISPIATIGDTRALAANGKRGSFMIVKGLIGILLGLGIGAGCRWSGIPLPGPQAIFGAVLAVAMATGFTVTDRLMASKQRSAAAAPSVSAEPPAPV